MRITSTSVYYICCALNAFGHGSIHALYTPWLVEVGLTYGQISFLNAIFWASVILLELPTGMLADGRGRGWSIMMGELMWAIGAFLYTQTTGFAWAVSCEIVLAFGQAFLSGAFTAWIKDAPDRDEEREPIRSVLANSTIIQGFATIAGSLMSVYLAEYIDPGVACFGILGLMTLAGSVLAFVTMRDKEPQRTMGEFEALSSAWTHLRSSSALRWSVAAQAGYGVFASFNMYWSLLLLTRMSQVELGWAWSGMHVAIAGSGWFVRSRVAARLSDGNGVAVSMIAAGLPMALLPVFPSTTSWVLLMMMHEFGRGAFRPFIDAYVQTRVDGAYRATFGSLCSLFGSIGGVIMLAACGTFMSFFDQPGSDEILSLWIWTSIAALFITLGLWRYRSPAHE